MRIQNLPLATPALSDFVVGSDVSDSDKTVRFSVEDLVALVEGASGATELDELTDVSVSGNDAPADGQALVYEAATGLWKPADVASGGGSIDSIQDIADVSPTSPQNGEVLQWDSATERWVPASIPAFTPQELDDLDDVAISSTPSNGEFLLFNGASSEFVPVQYRHVISLSPLDRGELISASYTGNNDQLLTGDMFIVPSALDGYEVASISATFNASAASEGVLIGLAVNGTPVASSGSEVAVPSNGSSADSGIQKNQSNYPAGGVSLSAADVIQLYIDASISIPGSGTQLFVTLTLVPDRT
jgi:hypothetical protein